MIALDRYRNARGAVPLMVACVGLMALAAPAAGEQDENARRLELLQQQIDRLESEMTERDRRIEELQRRLDEPAAERDASPLPRSEDALERRLRELGIDEEPPPRVDTDIARARVGDATLRLMDISLNAMFAVGGSTEDDDSLRTLQGGGHDPRKRGFTVQNIELGLQGAVDPYFYGETYINFFVDPIDGETRVELEEAFMTTQTLPWGLQARGGHYLTEFGRINPRHPHDWHWLDQPIINTRLLGADGMRSTGARLSWLTPLPWYSELFVGVQNAEGEGMVSFFSSEELFEGDDHGHGHAERAIGGLEFEEQGVRSLRDLAYSARWANAWDVTDNFSTQVGLSGIFGSNASGPDGYTFMYGADWVVKWRPEDHERGWPYIEWETEIMNRDYRVDRDNDHFVTGRLRDWGLYSQALYGFRPNWAAGLRGEFATGSGESEDGRDQDPFRADRFRISPVLIWTPTEFSRLRLQYNYDRSDHLASKDAHSVWFGFEVVFGAHPAHAY